MTRGIKALATYLPKRRLSRAAIAAAHAWAQPAAKAKGHIAAANWDEDAITLAHAAARRLPLDELNELHFCSTSAPFADRSPAVVLSSALNATEALATYNHSGSRRAASSATKSLLESRTTNAMVIAGEKRLAKPASPQESGQGDAGVALTVGEPTIASFLGGSSRAVDFVDQYRSSDSPFSYAFEDRWIRDQGLMQQIPAAITALLDDQKISADHVAHFCLNAPARVRTKIAKTAGLSKADASSMLDAEVGDTGCVHFMLTLAEALERAKPGDVVLSATFGQGVDLLLFEVNKPLVETFRSALTAGQADDNYLRFLSHRGLLELDWGKRAERDVRTAQSAYFRELDQLSSFVGGKCKKCGTVQFPRTQVCVNPECRAFGEQAPYSFANEAGRVKSFTEDWQAYSPEPPLIYGNVEFEGGANILMQFCDTDAGSLSVGATTTSHFRIKDVDRLRNYRRYFWKAQAVTG